MGGPESAASGSVSPPRRTCRLDARVARENVLDRVISYGPWHWAATLGQSGPEAPRINARLELGLTASCSGMLMHCPDGSALRPAVSLAEPHPLSYFQAASATSPSSPACTYSHPQRMGGRGVIGRRGAVLTSRR